MDKKKKILIDQPGFWGDIIFVMAIAQKYVNEGYIVDFPVYDEYINASIQKYFPTVNILPLSSFENNGYEILINKIDAEEYTILPLRESPNRGFNRHMENKYTILGLPVDLWREIDITRDYEVEKELLNILEINDGDKFNFINENHQPSFVKKTIPVNNEFRNVYMEKIKNFSIFDWIGVMERAQTIHTVGTSIIFLLEILKANPKEMHIYQRNDKNHSTYDYLLKRDFKYH